MNELMHAVQSALLHADLFHEKARLLCAFSAGADSTALLHALSRLRTEVPFALHAVYVQHGLRGNDSCEDEAFARRLCETLNVPLHVYAPNLGTSMHDPGVETRARDARRQIFANCMVQTRADALLTAHHRDDQTETVLMHLLRGSGMQGLCGMPERSPFAGGWLIRPFLSLPKERLLVALEAEGLAHREDLSNQETLTPRNTLRLSLLPKLKTLYPGADAHIAQLAETLAVDEAYIAHEANRLYQQTVYHTPPICAMAKEPLQSAPSALVRRVVRRLYAEAAKPDQALSHADTLALEQLLHAQKGTSLNLPGGWMAVCESNYVHLTQTGPLLASDEPQQTLAEQNARYAFRHASIQQETCCEGSPIPQTARAIILVPEALALSPTLRMPRPTDRIHPFGAPGSKPLRRYLTDRKVDPFFRYQRPVLAAGDDILWIPSLCVSELLRITAVPSGSIRLTDTAPLPLIPHQPKE